MDRQKLRGMTKEDLVATIAKILKTERDLGFLLRLAPQELEILVPCLRDWVDQESRK
jgi:hypothetical protein